MPAKEISQDSSDPEIEEVIYRRNGTLNEKRKYHNLKCIRNDRQNHRGLKVRALRNDDGMLVHGHVIHYRAELRSVAASPFRPSQDLPIRNHGRTLHTRNPTDRLLTARFGGYLRTRLIGLSTAPA